MKRNTVLAEMGARRPRVVRDVVAASVLAALLLAGVQCSTSKSSAPPLNNVDPEAAQALKQMCDTLRGAKSLRFTSHAVVDKPQEQTGQLTQFTRTSEITAVKPDRLFVTTEGDDAHWSAWFDGRTLTVLDREANEYATEKAGGGITGMLDHMADKYDLVMPMADFLVSNAHDSMLANAELGDYLGHAFVDGHECHQLLFRQASIDWQIWIDAGQTPVPRKLVIVRKLEPGQPQYAATLSDWALSPTIPAETFKFTPPDGATAVTMADLLETE